MLEWGVQDRQLVFTMVNRRFINFPIDKTTRFGERTELSLPAGEYRITGIGLEFSTAFSPEALLNKGAYINQDIVVFRIEPGKTTTLSILPQIMIDRTFALNFWVPSLMTSVVDEAGTATTATITGLSAATQYAFPVYSKFADGSSFSPAAASTTATTAATSVATTTTLTSSSNPAAFGAAITFTATVTASADVFATTVTDRRTLVFRVAPGPLQVLLPAYIYPGAADPSWSTIYNSVRAKDALQFNVILKQADTLFATANADHLAAAQRGGLGGGLPGSDRGGAAIRRAACRLLP